MPIESLASRSLDVIVLRAEYLVAVAQITTSVACILARISRAHSDALSETTQGDRELSNTPHTLRDEFPDHMDAIHTLKVKSPEFARILEEYDEVNDKIHRAETRMEPINEDAEALLRKMRLALKDKIVSALHKT